LAAQYAAPANYVRRAAYDAAENLAAARVIGGDYVAIGAANGDKCRQ